MTPLNVPPPPNTASRGVYYFLFGEWIHVYEGKSIATADNPNPQGFQQRKVGANECVAMHPAVWTIMCQTSRPGYTVKWAIGINEELYRWYKDVEARINAAAEAANQANGG